MQGSSGIPCSRLWKSTRENTTYSCCLYHRFVPSLFHRVIRTDRPVATAFVLMGVGFLVSLLVGLVAGLVAWLLAADFRSAFGWTGIVGMIVTAGVILAWGRRTGDFGYSVQSNSKNDESGSNA